MIRELAGKVLGGKQKRAIKTKLNQAKVAFVQRFRQYGASDIRSAFEAAGIKPTDTVLIHCNFQQASGFQGTPLDLVDVFADYLDGEGNLLMVSIPFRGSAYDYLEKGKPFKLLKTMSMMGLATEMFRRRPGTLRSLHPTHPVLAIGKDAEHLVADHEKCLHPCGAGTPFDKYRLAGGSKILFYDVPFTSITFFHHVEDLLADKVPFDIYEERVFDVTCIDAEGAEHVMQTKVFNRELRRGADKLEAEMERGGHIYRGRVGNSRFVVVDADQVVATHTEMVEAGNYPYHL